MLRKLITVSLLLGAGIAAPAAAETGEPPEYVTTPLFFTCKAPTPVHNDFGAMGFSATRPTASFQSGAGCGFFDQDLLVSTTGGGDDLVDAVFEGEFTGPVRSAAVELHDLLLTQAESTITGTVGFDLTLAIDGVEVINTVSSSPPPTAVPTPSSSGLSQSIRFGIDLAKLNLVEDKTRTFQLTIAKGYYDTTAAWVAGAAEVPAGITFNPDGRLPAPVVRPG